MDDESKLENIDCHVLGNLYMLRFGFKRVSMSQAGGVGSGAWVGCNSKPRGGGGAEREVGWWMGQLLGRFWKKPAGPSAATGL